MSMGRAAVLGAAAISFLVSGCAVIQQQKFKEAVAQVVQACKSSLADPALDPIRTKVAVLDPDEQTFAMRTNTDHVSAQEKPVIALWAQKRDECQANWRRTVAPMLPAQIVAVADSGAQVADSLVAELYLGQISYGELATKRAENKAELNTALANIRQALIVQNQQAQFQAQTVANQAIANWNSQMQTQALQQMQMQMSMPHPVNCQTVGGFTHCM
jgi:hypothetical protein